MRTAVRRECDPFGAAKRIAFGSFPSLAEAIVKLAPILVTAEPYKRSPPRLLRRWAQLLPPPKPCIFLLLAQSVRNGSLRRPVALGCRDTRVVPSLTQTRLLIV